MREQAHFFAFFEIYKINQLNFQNFADFRVILRNFLQIFSIFAKFCRFFSKFVIFCCKFHGILPELREMADNLRIFIFLPGNCRNLQKNPEIFCRNSGKFVSATDNFPPLLFRYLYSDCSSGDQGTGARPAAHQRGDPLTSASIVASHAKSWS